MAKKDRHQPDEVFDINDRSNCTSDQVSDRIRKSELRRVKAEQARRTSQPRGWR